MACGTGAWGEPGLGRLEGCGGPKCGRHRGLGGVGAREEPEAGGAGPGDPNPGGTGGGRKPGRPVSPNSPAQAGAGRAAPRGNRRRRLPRDAPRASPRNREDSPQGGAWRPARPRGGPRSSVRPCAGRGRGRGVCPGASDTARCCPDPAAPRPRPPSAFPGRERVKTGPWPCARAPRRAPQRRHVLLSSVRVGSDAGREAQQLPPAAWRAPGADGSSRADAGASGAPTRTRVHRRAAPCGGGACDGNSSFLKEAVFIPIVSVRIQK